MKRRVSEEFAKPFAEGERRTFAPTLVEDRASDLRYQIVSEDIYRPPVSIKWQERSRRQREGVYGAEPNAGLLYGLPRKPLAGPNTFTLHGSPQCLTDLYDFHGSFLVSDRLHALLVAVDPQGFESTPASVATGRSKQAHDYHLLLPSRVVEAYDADRNSFYIESTGSAARPHKWFYKLDHNYFIDASEVGEAASFFDNITGDWFWSADLIEQAQKAGMEGLRFQTPHGVLQPHSYVNADGVKIASRLEKSLHWAASLGKAGYGPEQNAPVGKLPKAIDPDAADPEFTYRHHVNADRSEGGIVCEASLLHASVHVAATATIAPLVTIGHKSVVLDEARVGARCSLGSGMLIGARSRISFSLIGEGVCIGDDVNISFSHIGAYCTIADGATVGGGYYSFGGYIGQHCWIGAGADIGHSSYLGMSAAVLAGASIATGARVEESAVVGERAKVGTDSRVGNSANIGADCVIGDGSIVDVKSVLGERVEIGHSTRIQWECKVGDASKIDDEVFIGAETRIGANVRIGACTRIGRNVTIGDGAEIGEWADIRDNAVIKPKGKVVADTRIRERPVSKKAPKSES